ncbi:MAG: hypothetical protein U5J82_05275 [Desulfobacterales bacterium]|nr:hypothetical protein [Desulfobacterales bacterium]
MVLDRKGHRERPLSPWPRCCRVFMVGLAPREPGARAGSSIVSPAPRHCWPLYGKLELGIGMPERWPCPLPWPAGRAGSTGRSTTPCWSISGATRRWPLAGCALVLIPPAALMGATLPVRCCFYCPGVWTILGRRTGWLMG